MKLEPGVYRCLSVWQPWAYAIFHSKGIENRNWPAPYRGKLLIHASKTTQDLDRVLRLLAIEAQLEIPRERLVFGAILGMVDLHDCKWSSVKSPCGWGVAQAYHWHLRNQTLLDQPIPWRGLQGLFTVRIGEITTSDCLKGPPLRKYENSSPACISNSGGEKTAMVLCEAVFIALVVEKGFLLFPTERTSCASQGTARARTFNGACSLIISNCFRLPTPMQKTQINPIILQPFFESASNAAQKGQAQFFTPIEWGQALCHPLPKFRPVLVDLSCGAGHLLQGASRGSTNDLLGCDIDPCPLVNAKGEPSDTPSIHRITADLTKLHSLMRAVDFRADCFVLNPAWDLHQYREPLAGLADSDLITVRKAFATHDGRTSKDTIDSTVASLAIALDRCSPYGDGMLIANEATLQRLILLPGAPHGALACHAWAHVVIRGNPMTGIQNCDHQDTFETGVLYFARGHDAGLPVRPSLYKPPLITEGLAQARSVCIELAANRAALRLGPEIKSYIHSKESPEQWKAIGQEWERTTHKDKPQWNLTLRPDGTIKTDLSLFDTKSHRVDKDQAHALFNLDGKHPMQLVMQRQQRRHLENAAFGNTWRVDPKLQEAVNNAITQYHAIRAPLYPLGPIQRLGFLDEVDDIVCSKNLGRFRADRSYPLRSATVAVKRSGEKLNLSGGIDEVEWDGQELAFFITDDLGTERIFMEGRLRAKNVRVSILQPGEKPGKQDEDDIVPCTIDFTLHELVDSFIIPDVPDVARVNPEGYQRNLSLLEEIEALCV